MKTKDLRYGDEIKLDDKTSIEVVSVSKDALTGSFVILGTKKSAVEFYTDAETDWGLIGVVKEGNPDA